MKHIFKKVADQHHVSEGEVQEEIEKAIQIAMDSDNPDARRLWGQIAPDGKLPTPEELIKKIMTLIM